MDFIQAEQHFRALETRRLAGTVDEAAYREELGALRVTDDGGRVWMMQERTGQWYVWDNGTWQAAEPPRPSVMPAPPLEPPAAALAAASMGRVATAVVPPVPVAAPIAATSLPSAPLVATLSAGVNGLGFVLPLLLWAAVFGALTYLGIQETDTDQNLLLYLGGPALIVLLMILWRLTRHYEGVIDKVRIETVTDTDNDGSRSTRKVTYAYIRTLEGKVKKVQAGRGFAQGDRVFKRKGDWNARKPRA
jgi:hypothetical protein